MRVGTPSTSLITPGGIALSDSERTEALTASVEAQCQPVNKPSEPAFIRMVDEALQVYSFASASKLN
jgi:hypothetical protein